MRLRFPRLFRLRSTLTLILTGFALVLIPLAVAFAVVTYFMNQIADQSEVLVRQAIKSTQGGRQLITQLTTMERSALQYMVVENEELLQLYRDTHEDFQNTIGELSRLTLTNEQRSTLLQLNRVERELFAEFGDPRASPAKGEKPVAWFTRARDRGQEFLRISNEWVDLELGKLQNLTSTANNSLFWIAFALVPAILLLTALFSMLIVRPLRSVSRAIYRLGSEDYDTPLIVRGPRDVEDLGKRLNWLRLQLSEIEKQKASFLRHMSHELKTPLTGIREAAELLSEEVIGPLNEDQRQVVRIMRENTFLFQELILNLVNFNQALLRNQALNYETLRLDTLIERVVITQQLAWKARQLRIDQQLEPVEAVVDRAKFTTIVDNLLSNAIKFSPKNETILLRLEMVDTRLAQLDVIDAGPGFHPDDRSQVFEAFYQGKVLPDSHVQGSGLGLAIVREYVEAHRGTIAVVDDTFGGHLRIKLPIQQED